MFLGLSSGSPIATTLLTISSSLSLETRLWKKSDGKVNAGIQSDPHRGDAWRSKKGNIAKERDPLSLKSKKFAIMPDKFAHKFKYPDVRSTNNKEYKN